MFGVGKKSGCSGIDTVIGSQTRLEGDVYFSGGLHVDGTIKGNLVAEPDTDTVLTVSEQGRIEGDVRVPNLVLNGAVQGDVYASERVELASHAKVTGNVYYNLIEMAMGAEVNGNLVHRAGPQRVSPGVTREDEDIESVETAGMSVAK
ncbi:MAG TPA: polymer-forming cytoskeletal family protein [Gammaproteobacteria bacterium]|nr:polymer-forming cytoskeletal family protein [Gammaproteobacteria bacterium]